MDFGVGGPEFPKGCAIVFGGSGGLGRATAALFARRGSDVLVTYHSKRDEANELVSEIVQMGRRAVAVQCDVADTSRVNDVYNVAAEQFNQVHSVISATGLLFDVKPLVEFSEKQFRDVIETDVIGFFNIAKAGVSIMRAHGGSLGALVTCATGRTVPCDSLSAIPKSAINTMVKQIAAEEGPNGIRANAVGPGPMDGGISLSLMQGKAKASFENLLSHVPLRRIGGCNDVAEALVFLASAKATYITGQILMVDGGASI